MKLTLNHGLGLVIVLLVFSNLRMHWRIEQIELQGTARLAKLDTDLRGRIAQLRTLDSELSTTLKRINSAPRGTETASSYVPTRVEIRDDAFNVRMPTRTVGPSPLAGAEGSFEVTPLSESERLRYLELKTNAYFNWGNYYNMESIVERSVCKKSTTLAEFDDKCKSDTQEPDEVCPGLYDHTICLDSFPPPASLASAKAPCIVYDFGIREQPEFGKMMATKYGCEVHAFDPSPISVQFYRANDELQKLPNYHFHEYGAGGRDGEVSLWTYNWGQVSIIQNAAHVNRSSCPPDYVEGGQCSLNYPHIAQKEFKLQVRTVPHIMKELNHKWIDVIKIDVEGSEYALLENIFDVMGCPPCNQLTVEWHHFPLDPRYGAGSSPPLNQLTTLLHKCGFRQFYHHLQGGWPTQDAHYTHMGMNDIRYNIVSFMRVERR